MDWIGAGINLVGWYLMPKNQLTAIVIFLVSNIFWISWGLSEGAWSVVIVQLCFMVLNIRAALISLGVTSPWLWFRLV